MFTFNVPIAKLGFAIPVTVPTNEQLMLHAEHGLKQRLNDTTAGLKRKDFKDDESYNEAVAEAVDKVRDKINAGLVGVRTTVARPVPKPTKAQMVEMAQSYSDEEFNEFLRSVGRLGPAAKAA